MALSRFALAAAVAQPLAGVRVTRKQDAEVTVTSFSKPEQSYHIRVHRDSSFTCEVFEAGWGQQHRFALDEVYAAEPDWVLEDEEGRTHSSDQILDFWGPTEEAVRTRAQKECKGEMMSPAAVADLDDYSPNTTSQTEVRCIVCSGDSSNRIDVVFMGDGYQLAEREKFFSDMERLTRDMFQDVTFKSWLPVFNIWAIHVPSVDSGIGYYGRAKNTPFGLYKNGEQHRAVLPTFTGQQRARTTCRLAGGCNYPSLIGNDEFYGGLGGEFVIGTRSKTTGTIVLRHEMGHNFVSVGEEYDDGQVYRGVNSDSPTWFGSNPKNPIKWQHWLTEPDKPVREEKQKVAFSEYPWMDLGRAGSKEFSFSADGTFASWEIVFTVSGYPEEGSLKLFLDGRELPWQPRKMPGAERPDGTSVDRLFYYFYSADHGGAFSRGTHTLRFVNNMPRPEDGPMRQLCNVAIREFGNDEEFNSSPGYVGAYPSWSFRGAKSYRPTNNMCLMRDMESKVFCPVDIEGMWLQFFGRMSPIDSVDVSTSGNDVTVDLQVVPLAQFREDPVSGITESFNVVWKKGGQVQEQFNNEFSFSGSSSALGGSWTVEVTYVTSEVRKDDRNLLTNTRSFSI